MLTMCIYHHVSSVHGMVDTWNASNQINIQQPIQKMATAQLVLMDLLTSKLLSLKKTMLIKMLRTILQVI